MQDFPANSKKAQATEAPREKLQPVTSAETVRRKRGLGRQFKDAFIGGNGRDAFGYALEEVIVPAIRDTIAEALQGGIERLIYGERTNTRPRSSSIMSSGMGHVAYNAMSSPSKSPAQQRALSRTARARHDFGELRIPSRQEAEEVLDRMFDLLSRDGEVRLAHLYELADVRPEHTDWKWGWTNLRGAKAVRTRRGDFILNLPEPEPM